MNLRFRSREIWRTSNRHSQCINPRTIHQHAAAGLRPPQRQYRDDFWIPQAELKQSKDDSDKASQLLVKAGYIRQAYAGIFQMLPLGLRVQNKLEALIDKHMRSLRASKVSLSSISSQKLWERTGRLVGSSELFRFRDRRSVKWLLAPTHEEEITSLVKEIVFSPSHLPVRAYQVSRKYRDEKRPRGGLLRGREFLMKDLYTFDKTTKEAHVTYTDVRQAYRNFFDELRVPYIEAQADSGSMGGKLSHEYHFRSSVGEDDVMKCTDCSYARNEEFVPDLQVTSLKALVGGQQQSTEDDSAEGAYNPVSQVFVSKDQNSLIRAFATRPDTGFMHQINPFVVKAALAQATTHVEVDTGVEDPISAFMSNERPEKSTNTTLSDLVTRPPGVYYLFDDAARPEDIAAARSKYTPTDGEHMPTTILQLSKNSATSLLRTQNGDPCPDCATAGRHGQLTVIKAIEVGHTFHLGDRYTSSLNFQVPRANAKEQKREFVSMGCHGIGVSRLIAAVASCLADEQGLNWPRAIAPFEVVILANNQASDNIAEITNEIYDGFQTKQTRAVDVLIDDRADVQMGWKLKDADLIGYPVVLVLGQSWTKDAMIEVQCRQLGRKLTVPLDSVHSAVAELLDLL